MSSQGVLTQELKDKLLQQHKDAESSLAQVHEARRQQQVKNLQDKMAQRRKRKFDKLRDEQEKYKNEVSVFCQLRINRINFEICILIIQIYFGEMIMKKKNKCKR